ncbi:hypothetical protein BDY19DRAFT_994576 [Irpex rosettiformis]|uniref:Uncharacterized protein n=1 Tax=Irpex rosettiformis TaxID=378272 RepID=A0ACB8U0A1_9APHY|nr:hypothetical protein BDY19DRAFT_994576 [Irpex rosettiformis]
MPPTYCPCNKPILKRRSLDDKPIDTTHGSADDLLHIDPSVLGQPTVRFPPHATLVSRTFLAIPRDEYDRSPIVVTPNACRLPERGCPGRTYRESSPSPSSRRRPRSPTARRTHAHLHTVLPPLVPDLTSSSSDESDGSLPLHPPSIPLGRPLIFLDSFFISVFSDSD